MAIRQRLEICKETADDLRDVIRGEVKREGRLYLEAAKLWKGIAKRDAAYHAIFGFSFFTDQRGQRSKRWRGHKLHEPKS